jgi:hypothetical protein
MKMTIKTKNNGTITFSRPGGGYIYADLNGQPGTLGRQICAAGRETGNTLAYSGDDSAEFARICRNWVRSLARHL